MRKQGFVTLMFDAEAFEQEMGDGSKLDDAMLLGFGIDMNDQAAHLLGYEGWITGWTNVPEESDQVRIENAVSMHRGQKHVLMVDKEGIDYEPPVLFGPFDTVKQAQDFAENFREANGLPREATSDNNEEWSNAGWYFGIFQPSKTIEKWS